MNPKEDPALNRDEFVKRLDKIFNWRRGLKVEDCLKAIVQADTGGIGNLKKKIQDAEERKKRYLAAYDAAVDEDAKRKVVASVKVE